jgi:hypothetical protein
MIACWRCRRSEAPTRPDTARPRLTSGRRSPNHYKIDGTARPGIVENPGAPSARRACPGWCGPHTAASQKAAVPRTNCHKAKPAQRLIRLLRNPDEPGMHCRVMPLEQASFDRVVVEACFSGVRTMHTYEKAPAQGSRRSNYTGLLVVICLFASMFAAWALMGGVLR